jgi:hypothetical protein
MAELFTEALPEVPCLGFKMSTRWTFYYSVGNFTTLINSASSFQWPFDGDDQCRVCVSPLMELTGGLDGLLLESLWLPIVNFSLIPWIQLRAFFLDLSIPIFFFSFIKWDDWIFFLFSYSHSRKLILLFLSWGFGWFPVQACLRFFGRLRHSAPATFTVG